MRQRALIVEPTRLFHSILDKILASAGVECVFFPNGKEALEADHEDYDFILISRTLEDVSGEVFLSLFGVRHGLGHALKILLTSNDEDTVIADARAAGYDRVLNRKAIDSLYDIVVQAINHRTLDLHARILFVEDVKSMAEMTVKLFEENNSHILHVSDIEAMKQAFTVQDFDLVVTDYYLKNDETGDEVIDFVRGFSDVNKARTPILVVSGEDNKEKRVSFLRYGANDFIIKPYDANELLVRASHLVSHSKLLRQLHDQQKQLMKAALTDHLTGLYNRHSLSDIAPKYISNAYRHDTDLSLLVIDLDHFKQINDSQGHSVGDSVLRDVARVMIEECRSEDIAARFGGEEFVMLLVSCHEDDAMQKAEYLRIIIDNLEPEGVPVTASIGVAGLGPDDDFNSLFDKADQALFEAKNHGRNRVARYEPPFD